MASCYLEFRDQDEFLCESQRTQSRRLIDESRDHYFLHTPYIYPYICVPQRMCGQQCSSRHFCDLPRERAKRCHGISDDNTRKRPPRDIGARRFEANIRYTGGRLAFILRPVNPSYAIKRIAGKRYCQGASRKKR